MSKFFLITCILFFSIDSIPGQVIIPEDNKLVVIRKEIQEMIEKKQIPSLAIGVVKDGKILWQEAIGYADRDNNIFSTIHHAYPLGSVSKSVTATAMMALVNNNKLNLHTDIRSYLSGIKLKNVKGETPEIKLWQLLSMNSGLSHGYGTFSRNKGIPKTSSEKKIFFEKAIVVAFEPGKVYEYTNHSFSVSELIAENISGKSFQEFMNQTLFHPLGMMNSYAYPETNPLEEKNTVNTYDAKMIRIQNDFIGYPAGGMSMWSSISDMNRYLMFHLGFIKDNTLINDSLLNLMHNFRQGPADLFGIGFFNNGGELFSDGNVGGGNACIMINKEENLAIVCLLNRTSWEGIAVNFAGKIKNAFIKDKNSSGFQTWQRIYGTPYTPKYELNGIWSGTIIEPVSKKTISVQLNFTATGTVSIKVNGKESLLRNTTYNLLNELEAGCTILLPGITTEEVRCGIKLKRTDNRFSGYMQYDGEVNGVGYRLPLFVGLKKM